MSINRKIKNLALYSDFFYITFIQTFNHHMKNLLLLLFITPTILFAQPTIQLGVIDNSSIYSIENSFIVFSDSQYIGLSVLNRNNIKHYKIPKNYCATGQQFYLLEINDKNTQVISSHNTNLHEDNLYGTIAASICDFHLAYITCSPNLQKTTKKTEFCNNFTPKSNKKD